jgi:cytoskeletal protein CcmA (bactofilin family)/DNA-directed RNA polymerase subunit RPC12/RpoP
MKAQKVVAACPKCGHQQPEPAAAYSTVCKACGQHFRLDENPREIAPHAPSAVPCDTRRVVCFTCGTELDVSAAAQSTMCKRCSSYVDLQDYRITTTVSKNLRTKGRIVVEENGQLLNTDTIATEIVVKGRVIGKIKAESLLELHSTARIKGTFQAGRLVIPPAQHFTWAETLAVAAMELGGELVANVCATGTVLLKSTARLFGNVQAPHLVVQSGAVWVGQGRVGSGQI